MHDSPSTVDEVVDLLATWGATVQPGAAELFRVLAESRPGDGLELLQSVLGARGDLLDPALRDELSRIHESRRGSGAGSGDPAALKTGLERASRALASRIADRRGDLGERVKVWSVALEPSDLNGCLDLLWRADAADDLQSELDALDHLDRLEQRLDESRAHQLNELREWLGSEPAAAADSALVETLRDTLNSDDPETIAAARRTLRQLSREGNRQQLEREIGQAREGLIALCTEYETGLLGSASTLDGTTRGFLRSAIEAARAATTDADEGTGPSLEALEIHRSTLRALAEPSAEADSGKDRRAAVAQAVLSMLSGELRRFAGDRPGGETDGADELLKCAEEGGRGFQESLERVSREWRSLREQSVSASKKQAQALRKQIDRLAHQLESSVKLLTTEQAVRSRLLIERARTAVAVGDVRIIEELHGALTEQADAQERFLNQVRARRRSAGDARRRGLIDRASALQQLTAGASRKRLGALAEVLEQADADELSTLEQRLQRVARPVENAVRMKAARLLARCGPDNSTEGPLAELAAAFEADDLPAMTALAEDVRSLPGVGGPLRGPRARVALAATGLLIVAGAIWGWQQMSDRSRAYSVMLDATRSLSGSVTVTLVREGRVHGRQEYDAASGAAFRLTPGQYEIYVNDLYTGRVLRVPDDASEVTGVPVPSSVTD